MSTLPSLSFGALLRRYRQAAGLTQEELAERARLSRDAIDTLERGIRRTPRKATLALLAEALALTAPERALLEAAARQHELAASPTPARGAFLTPPGSPSWPLVGRVQEQALLDRHLCGEGPPVVLLSGAPGLGKSRLLEEAARRGRAFGWAVLEGRCHRYSAQDPYAPVREALGTALLPLPPAHIRRVLEGCPWVPALLPELAERGFLPALPGRETSAEDRPLLFASVARLLRNVAGPRGTLLLLDDLQWAGADAMMVLTALMPAFASGQLRLVGAYRSTEVSPRTLSLLLADLAQAGLLSHTDLAPLSAREARDLLEVLLEGDLVELEETPVARMLQRAAGVPFFLVSFVQGVQAGALDRQATGIPWDTAQGIRQRVAALPEGSQRLLEVTAVIGQEVQPRFLAALTALPEPEVLQALEQTERAGLLREHEAGTYQISHDLIREVLLGEVSRARQAFLHRQIAHALEQAPGEPDPERLAYHYTQGDELRQAVLFVERAGDRARTRQAHLAAEGHYRTLVEQYDRWGQSREAARAREKLGSVLLTLARYEAAFACLEQARAVYQQEQDLEGIGRTTAQLGWVYALRGTPAEGVEPIEQVLAAESSARLSAQGRAALYDALAELYLASGRYREQLAAAEQATREATAAQDLRLLSQASMCRGTALLLLGRLTEAASVLEEAIPAIERAGDLRDLASALNNLALVYQARGAFSQYQQAVERAWGAALQLGDPALLAVMGSNRGDAAYLTGTWDVARTHYERAAEVLRPVGPSWAAPYPVLGLGLLTLATDPGAEVERQLEEAITEAAHRGDWEACEPAIKALAEQALLEERPEQARARLHLLQEQAEEASQTTLLPWLAWVALQEGKEAEAEALVTRAIQQATTEQHQLALVEALQMQARLQARQGGWGQAQEALESALRLCRAMPHPYAEAKLLFLSGVVHQTQGERSAARTDLEAALARLHQLGERFYADQVAQALATLERE